MNTPKHLWSGDWERESTDPPAERPYVAAPPLTHEPTPPASPTEPSAGRGWRTRQTALAAAAVLVLVIIGVALAVSLGGNGKTQPQQRAQAPTAVPAPSNGSGGAPLQPPTPPVQTQTTAAPVTVGPTYSWLGTQLIDSTSGVTVETVRIGSAADTAGINPGDVIESVANSGVASIAQLKRATANLRLGQTVQLTVNRGTTLVTLTATLANRPVKQP
jgi:hypothetical protein